LRSPNPILELTQPRAILDFIKGPYDLRLTNTQELRQAADELRAETISAVAVTGGHLGASLGVTELTVAPHYVFDTPRDKIIWNVGHWAYPHKILTDSGILDRNGFKLPTSVAARRLHRSRHPGSHLCQSGA
jgi:transketolase N-terminal domain/subunit